MRRTKKEMKTCGECKHFKNCRLYNYKENPACGAFAEPTNFDKITDKPEKLAKFINEILDEATEIYEDGGTRCPFQRRSNCGNIDDCVKCIIRWLKQKAEEEDG